MLRQPIGFRRRCEAHRRRGRSVVLELGMNPQSPIERLRVELDARGYDILIGPGLIARAGEEILPLMRRKQAVIVTDEIVARHHLSGLQASLSAAAIAQHTVTLPPGEATKDLAHFGRLVDDILALGIERGTMLVALGGGVVGDIAGFAAATLLRGIDFVQIPTTLLAQVDSSVGGKTAINTTTGKNLLGAFYQPRLVLADTASLGTLPRRELRAGYAEILKYGLIRDAGFFDWLETNGDAVCDLEPAALTHAITVSCRMKATIVAADEREAGDRELLNFGHTFGHALEAETGFSDRLLHGEAVALGMALAFDFAVRLGLASGQDSHRVRRHLAAAALPTQLAAIGLCGRDADRLLAHMGKDKKVRDGRITLILPRKIGDAFRTSDVPAPELRSFLTEAG
jgi:3-dehydroquinate synthase